MNRRKFLQGLLGTTVAATTGKYISAKDMTISDAMLEAKTNNAIDKLMDTKHFDLKREGDYIHYYFDDITISKNIVKPEPWKVSGDKDIEELFKLKHAWKGEGKYIEHTIDSEPQFIMIKKKDGWVTHK